MNKKQKHILYKNMGILFALTVLCAVFARRILHTGGETLQDLAEKNAAQSEDETVMEEESLSRGEEPVMETPATDDKMPYQEETPVIDDETLYPEEETAMEDRVIYQEGFYYESLNDAIKERINGISYPADDSNAAISYDTLRYVSVLYYDLHDVTQSGELICHKAIAQDLVEIFYELYEAHYPIEKITLVDNYQGDDSLSMQDNNTSCFNYRALPSGKLSNHAYGLAIDLNPFYNPYVTYRDDGSVNITPAGSEQYADREQSFICKIDKEDLAYQLFIEHGFTWGGSWRSSKDYQHFEKEI